MDSRRHLQSLVALSSAGSRWLARQQEMEGEFFDLCRAWVRGNAGRKDAQGQILRAEDVTVARVLRAKWHTWQGSYQQ